VSTAIWVCLGFCLAALLGGTVWVTASAVHALRQTKRIPGRVLGQLDALAARVTVLERRVASLGGRAEDLQRNLAHLSVSLARLRTLLDALQEVRGAVAGVLAFLPSK
jgi:hypothetical protein